MTPLMRSPKHSAVASMFVKGGDPAAAASLQLLSPPIYNNNNNNNNNCSSSTAANTSTSTHSAAALAAQRVTSLDEQIVAACNELIRLKSLTAKKRVEQANEKARMQREREQAESLAIGQWKAYRSKTVISKKSSQVELLPYQQACEAAFSNSSSSSDGEEDDAIGGTGGMVVPAYCAARQAQLCQHVHLMTAGENQFLLLQQHLCDEQMHLHKCISALHEEQVHVEMCMLNQICQLQQDIHDLQHAMNLLEQKRQERLTASVVSKSQKSHNNSDMSSVGTVSTCSMLSQDEDANNNNHNNNKLSSMMREHLDDTEDDNSSQESGSAAAADGKKQQQPAPTAPSIFQRGLRFVTNRTVAPAAVSTSTRKLVVLV